MADQNSASQPGATSGEGESDTSPNYVTKEEINVMLNGLRKSFKKDLETATANIANASQPKEEVQPVKLPKAESDATVLELQKQIKTLMQEKTDREAELAKQTLHNTLREHLTQYGVNPQFADHAIAFINQKNLISQDEDGSYKMKVNKLDYDLSDAVKLWSKTEEAKLYMLPKGTKGSGQTGPLRQGDNTPSKSAETLEDVLEQFTKAALDGSIFQ